MAKFQFNGKTALVTGAASGIGAEITRNLARRGCNLALADINDRDLDTLRDELRNTENRIRISTHLVDIAAPGAAASLVQSVTEEHGELTLLVNNAGVALAGTFEEIQASDFDRLMEVNFAGPVRLTREALPHLKQASESAVVNVSSLFGIVAPPGQTAYSSSKFALRGFSEALRQELAESSVNVLVVHPGGVHTNIARNAKMSEIADHTETKEMMARMENALKMPPQRAADIIMRAVEKKKGRVIVGSDARFLELVQRLVPGRYQSVINKLS